MAFVSPDLAESLVISGAEDTDAGETTEGNLNDNNTGTTAVAKLWIDQNTQGRLAQVHQSLMFGVVNWSNCNLAPIDKSLFGAIKTEYIRRTLNGLSVFLNLRKHCFQWGQIDGV